MWELETSFKLEYAEKDHFKMSYSSFQVPKGLINFQWFFVYDKVNGINDILSFRMVDTRSFLATSVCLQAMCIEVAASRSSFRDLSKMIADLK
jgi:hypothetical protein